MSAPLVVTDLNFEEIKANLRDHMRASNDFTDFDYEASGLSFLIDTLAYNTHYNAVLANFMANEMFLDTAVKRSSVISHAKALGYHPQGHHASRAMINLTINSLALGVGQVAPTTFVLRRGTLFTTSIGNTYYQFVLARDYSAVKTVDDKYHFTNIELVEGVLSSYSWLVNDTTDLETFYTIPNARVDLSTVTMTVSSSTFSADEEHWVHSSTLFNIDETSKVFFSQESLDNKLDLYFGNGVIGAKPDAGNVVRVEYVSCNGSSANGAKVFTPGTLLHNNISEIAVSTYDVTLVAQSSQGAEGESIDEIKYHASKHFTVQNRAITPYDFVSIIKSQFFNIESVKVWGGEDNVPPQYNSVFVCIKPKYTDFLTTREKDQIREIINAKSLMNIRVSFTDPEYLNLIVETIVYYNPTKLSSNVNLDAIVKTAIANYSDLKLESFTSPMKFSNLLRVIDDADVSINNNDTIIKAYKEITPQLGKNRPYVISFLNQLKISDASVVSTEFTSTDSPKSVIMKNIGTALFIGYYDVGGKFNIVKEVGSVDFVNGTVFIQALNVLSFVGESIKVTVLPATSDVLAQQNTILRVKSSDIIVKPVSDSTNQPRVIAFA